MTATLTTPTVADAIAELRNKRQADLHAARTALAERGIEPYDTPSMPPSDEELLLDLWWYTGMLTALDDLANELDID